MDEAEYGGVRADAERHTSTAAIVNAHALINCRTAKRESLIISSGEMQAVRRLN